MVKDFFNKKIFQTFGAVTLSILKFIVLMCLSDLFFCDITYFACVDNFHLSKNMAQIISNDISDIGIIILGYAHYKLNYESMIKDCEIRKISLPYAIKAFFIGTCMVAISFLLTTAIMDIFHLQSNSYGHVQKIYSMFSNNIWLVYSPLIIAPICEELLCRGMLFHRLQKLVNVKVAIVIQAIFFACIHENIIQFGYTFLMGIIAGYLVYYTKSILTSIVFHFANNLFALTSTGIFNNSKILENIYIILAPIIIVYLLWNIKRNSLRLNVT